MIKRPLLRGTVLFLLAAMSSASLAFGEAPDWNGQHNYPMSSLSSHNNPYSVQRDYAQNDSRKEVRSRSDVVREVKRRYDAQVLKITLNQQRSAYRVRILMPNGRVREVTVSARR